MASRLELFALFGCFLAFGDAVTQPEFDCRARQVMPEAVAGSASCMNMCCTYRLHSILQQACWGRRTKLFMTHSGWPLTAPASSLRNIHIHALRARDLLLKMLKTQLHDQQQL